MQKIAFIVENLKDNNFTCDKDAINFQMFKALIENDNFSTDIFCIENNLTGDYKTGNIRTLEKDNFYDNAIKLAKQENYNLTISTEYTGTDISYIYRHSAAFSLKITKSKAETLLDMLFNRKTSKNVTKRINAEKKATEKNITIITPSTILKNDLINQLQVDGQKIYLLPPFSEIKKMKKEATREKYTFGFISDNFFFNGGIILLKTLLELKTFDFKIKIVLHKGKEFNILNSLIKLLKLHNITEITVDNYKNSLEFCRTVDCLILPYKNECFGLLALHAMAMGKIVLASSRCGIKDIIETDNNAIIFDITQKPVNNLKNAMKYILFNKDNLESMQQKAIYTASTYNFDKFKSELSDIIDKTISRKEM